MFKELLSRAQKVVNEELVAPKRKEMKVATRPPLTIKPAFWIKKIPTPILEADMVNVSYRVIRVAFNLTFFHPEIKQCYF